MLYEDCLGVAVTEATDWLLRQRFIFGSTENCVGEIEILPPLVKGGEGDFKNKCFLIIGKRPSGSMSLIFTALRHILR